MESTFLMIESSEDSLDLMAILKVLLSDQALSEHFHSSALPFEEIPTPLVEYVFYATQYH